MRVNQSSTKTFFVHILYHHRKYFLLDIIEICLTIYNSFSKNFLPYLSVLNPQIILFDFDIGMLIRTNMINTKYIASNIFFKFKSMKNMIQLIFYIKTDFSVVENIKFAKSDM